MLTEVDTDVRGVTLELLALAWVNLVDARRDPKVRRELERRCTAPPGVGFVYTSDLPKRDRWSSFVPLMQRTPADQPIRADCEDQTAAHAAAALLLEPYRFVEVAITQPEPDAMAHAYNFVDGAVFDACTRNGMKAPPATFYGSGETARCWVLDPEFLFRRVMDPLLFRVVMEILSRR